MLISIRKEEVSMRLRIWVGMRKYILLQILRDHFTFR